MYSFTKKLEKNKTPEDVIKFCKSNPLTKFLCKKKINQVRSYLRIVEGIRPKSPTPSNKYDPDVFVRLGLRRPQASLIPLAPWSSLEEYSTGVKDSPTLVRGSPTIVKGGARRAPRRKRTTRRILRRKVTKRRTTKKVNKKRKSRRK
jgi:hypothetical protein